MIDHGEFTEALLAVLSTTGELIGDGIAPSEAGWLAGQPNVEVFRPYGVLVDGGMQPIQTPQHLKSTRRDWTATWSLRYFGGSRRQCDWIAGQFRPMIDTLFNMEFGVDPHKIINVTQMIGSVMRNDQVDPPYWQVIDNVTMHVTPHNAKPTP